MLSKVSKIPIFLDLPEKYPHIRVLAAFMLPDGIK
jgi:hypothetical protein